MLESTLPFAVWTPLDGKSSQQALKKNLAHHYLHWARRTRVVDPEYEEEAGHAVPGLLPGWNQGQTRT